MVEKQSQDWEEEQVGIRRDGRGEAGVTSGSGEGRADTARPRGAGSHAAPAVHVRAGTGIAQMHYWSAPEPFVLLLSVVM